MLGIPTHVPPRALGEKKKTCSTPETWQRKSWRLRAWFWPMSKNKAPIFVGGWFLRAPLVFGIHVVGHFPWRLPFSDILSVGFPSRQTWNDLVKANSYQDQSSTDMLAFKGVIFFSKSPTTSPPSPKDHTSISFSDTYSTLTSMMYPGCQPLAAHQPPKLKIQIPKLENTVDPSR